MSRTNRILPSEYSYTFGTGEPTRGIVVCLHGNEPCGLAVLPLLRELRFTGTVKFVIGNPRALKQKKRYIEQDLNSSFPGSERGAYEARRAKEILAILSDCDEVLDLHSTSRSEKPFGISIGRESSFVLAEQLGLRRLVVMPKKLKKGRSLLDHLPETTLALSVECGTHDSQSAGETVRALTKRFLADEMPKQQGNMKRYQVTAILRFKGKIALSKKIRDFNRVKKGEVLARADTRLIRAKQLFYPVLFGEAAYLMQGVLGLAAEERLKRM